jgi:hypothetical protein
MMTHVVFSLPGLAIMAQCSNQESGITDFQSSEKCKGSCTLIISRQQSIYRGPVGAVRCGLICGIFMVVAHNLIFSSDIPSWTREGKVLMRQAPPLHAVQSSHTWIILSTRMKITPVCRRLFFLFLIPFLLPESACGHEYDRPGALAHTEVAMPQHNAELQSLLDAAVRDGLPGVSLRVKGPGSTFRV